MVIPEGRGRVNSEIRPKSLSFFPEAPPKAALEPVAAITGYQRPPVGRRFAPLTIKTIGPYNYIVRLYDETDRYIAAEIYIKGGEIFHDEFPLGNYYLRYASGTTWYGRNARFGDDTDYYRALEEFQFRSTADGYEGYTIELYRQQNGNLSTRKIPPEEFGA